MTNTINITLKGFFPIIIHPEENEEEVKRDIGEYFKKNNSIWFYELKEIILLYTYMLIW